MSDAVNMAEHVAPKSDQLNADDLISGPRTITITRVRANGGNADQPVAIHFEGDNNKPYLACKSMRRLMVRVWGSDTRAYIGRSMTLYCDPDVQFGGMKVGGIRISHMSHIDAPQTVALTATRARRAPFTVQPLLQTGGTQAPSEGSSPLLGRYEACKTSAEYDLLEVERKAAWGSLSAADKAKVKAASVAASARLAEGLE